MGWKNALRVRGVGIILWVCHKAGTLSSQNHWAEIVKVGIYQVSSVET